MARGTARAAPARMTVSLELDRGDVTRMARAYAGYIDDVKRETHRAADEHARAMVPNVRATAVARGRQAALAAKSVRYAGNATIVAGGAGSVPASRGNRLPAGGDLFFGSEFGAHRYKQFPRPRKGGAWYLRTISRGRNELRDRYERALARAARRWGAGG